MAPCACTGGRVLRALSYPPGRDRLLQEGGAHVADLLSQQQRRDRDRHSADLLAYRAGDLLSDRAAVARAASPAIGRAARVGRRRSGAGCGTLDPRAPVATARLVSFEIPNPCDQR